MAFYILSLQTLITLDLIKEEFLKISIILSFTVINIDCIDKRYKVKPFTLNVLMKMLHCKLIKDYKYQLRNKSYSQNSRTAIIIYLHRFDNINQSYSPYQLIKYFLIF